MCGIFFPYTSCVKTKVGLIYLVPIYIYKRGCCWVRLYLSGGVGGSGGGGGGLR